MDQEAIDRLDMQSPDLVNENFEKLAALFPNCVTETTEGRGIDFDLLKAKNAFDPHTNTRQRKLLKDKVQRITWVNKLSSETINLHGKDIREIQIFKIELKIREKIDSVLDIVDKAIPYHLIFWVQHEDSAYISVSAKHPHPVNDDNAVIDWTFRSGWFDLANCPIN